MTRTVSTGFSDELDQTVIQPFLAVDLLFDSPNELYFWTGLGDLVGPTIVANVSGATNANPVVITTSSDHQLFTGDEVTFASVGGMTQLNGNTYTITVISNTTFSLDGVNGTGFGTYTSGGTATVSGNTYIGTADILGISPIEETTEIAARGAQFVMTGLPASLVSLALTEPYQGRVAKVYFGLIPMPARLLAEDGSVLTSEDLYPISIAPDINTEFVEIFSGFMDVMSINDASDTATITISVENRLIDLERARSRRYTSEDQKQIAGFTTDEGFDFVTDMQDKEIRWGG